MQIDVVIHNPHILSHGSKIKFQKLTEDKIRAREIDNLKHTFSWLGHLNEMIPALKNYVTLIDKGSAISLLWPVYDEICQDLRMSLFFCHMK